MLTEKLVQYHSLLGHSQGCLSTEEVRFLLFCVFSLLGQAQVALLHRRYPRATSLLDLFQVLLCEYIGEYFNSRVVPTGTSPVFNKQNRLDLAY